MKTFLRRCLPLALTLLFAIAVAVCWAMPFVGALNYQEQYQLFLRSGDYFLSRLAVPGGIADYIAEFLTQYNYIPVVGAALIALLFGTLQRLTWRVSSRLGAGKEWYGLSFVTVFVLWIYQSDPSVLQSLTIALIAAMAVMRLFIVGKKPNPLLLIILLPLFYWLFGTVVYVVVGAVVIEAMRRKEWVKGGLAIVYTLIFIYVISRILPYPTGRLFGGLHYYRYPSGVPAMQWGVMGIALLMPYLAACLPRARAILVNVLVIVAVGALGGVGVWTAFNSSTQALIAYDYLVRAEKWDTILAKAQQNPPEAPMDVAIVNLALSQKGQLLDRMFAFYQNGSEGLFLPFTRDLLSPLSAAEIFFRLGFVNDCERYCFEALQAIPDFQRSGRLLKRITQCEVANGQYDVARRYLHVLQKTTFYRSWATNTLALLDDEDAIDAHPIYSRLRSYREQKTDYLFSAGEMDTMVGLLLMNNGTNRMAYEYLIAYELLQRNLQHFNDYIALGQDIGYSRLPTAVQEVLIGQWLQGHDTLQDMPYKVDNDVVRATVSFIQTYTANPNDPRLEQAPLKNNVWHYLLRQ